ncbi:glycosyltransferase family 4 protein [bacterium]|nr:glycosyltransferase family 4 protein [bacterium]
MIPQVPQWEQSVRILHALNSYEEDGPGHLLFRLCQRWRPMEGLQIGTVALSRGGPLEDRFRELGISTELVESRGTAGLLHLKEWARGLSKRLDSPDVIHSHLLWPDLSLRLVHKELGRIPLVSTCHGLHALDEKGIVKGLAYRVMERSTRKHCSAWIAISEFVREQMLAADYPKERVHLVRNGVDCVQTYPIASHRKQQLRRMLNLPLEVPLIGAVGTMRALKGHDYLLRAMPAILEKHPETHLLLIGAGPARDEIESEVSRLNLDDRVTIIGPLSTMLPQIMSLLDILVHPSLIEAFGLVVAEAQACGTPVIGSRVGGIPENIVDGETGFLVDPASPDQIAEKVILLLDDPMLRAQLGAQGRAFINEERELGTTAEGYVELWRQIVGWTESSLFPEDDEEQEQAFDTREFKLD